ncbi:MAG: elongation factor P [Candidatus Porifericomitaceae bacterium WSBS_2022_MAG_OTU9]
MSNYSTSEFKQGLKILIDGEPYAIVDNEFVKPGKGQAFNRVKLRNLKTGRALDKTFRSGESVEAADVIESEMQYLYKDGDAWYFMNHSDYEQYAVSALLMAETGQWLKGEELCSVTVWNGVPIMVAPPATVQLKITETDPGVKGDTATGGSKEAALESGARVRVPLFVQEGEVIRVDTRTAAYLGRFSEKE